jgi:hypothetical protein
MRMWLLAALIIFSGVSSAFAKSSDDHVTMGGDITVNEGETAGDIACVFCTVRVHGEVSGDVAVLFGKVMVDPGQSISGDVAALGADLNLGEGSTVNGDVAIAAGNARLAPGATIRGDRMILPSGAWLLLPLAPLLILAGLIWLVVWLVRRNRYQFPAYPQGRRL